MSCVLCNKGFSCGCQKMVIDGVTIHKTCQAEWKKRKLATKPVFTSEKIISNLNSDLSLEQVNEQVKDLK